MCQARKAAMPPVSPQARTHGSAEPRPARRPLVSPAAQPTPAARPLLRSVRCAPCGPASLPSESPAPYRLNAMTDTRPYATVRRTLSFERFYEYESWLRQNPKGPNRATALSPSR